jgi:hypothetical protein
MDSQYYRKSQAGARRTPSYIGPRPGFYVKPSLITAFFIFALSLIRARITNALNLLRTVFSSYGAPTNNTLLEIFDEARILENMNR